MYFVILHADTKLLSLYRIPLFILRVLVVIRESSSEAKPRDSTIQDDSFTIKNQVLSMKI